MCFFPLVVYPVVCVESYYCFLVVMVYTTMYHAMMSYTKDDGAWSMLHNGIP